MPHERISAGFMGKLGQKTLSLFSNFPYICLFIWLGTRGSRFAVCMENTERLLAKLGEYNRCDSQIV